MSVADDARDVAALLRRDGWRQHASGPRNTDARAPRCLMGAVDAVTRLDWRRGGPLHDALRDALVPWRLGLTTWNDAPGRAQDEVFALLAKVSDG